MYGKIDGQIPFPDTPAGMGNKGVAKFHVTHRYQCTLAKTQDKKLIDNFEIVVGSRWPTVQDIRAPRWTVCFLKVERVGDTLSTSIASLLNCILQISSSPYANLSGKAYESAERNFGNTPPKTSSGIFRSLAQVYDSQSNPLLLLEERHATSLLPSLSGCEVLDIGCGTGRWLSKLELLGPASLAGMDCSSAMLKYAQEKIQATTQLYQVIAQSFRAMMSQKPSYSLRLFSAISGPAKPFAQECAASFGQEDGSSSRTCTL